MGAGIIVLYGDRHGERSAERHAKRKKASTPLGEILIPTPTMENSVYFVAHRAVAYSRYRA
ncbi:hypothetical protein X942_5959 [Burkholderia pseudomallei MSHR5596]|nr:hypothetical protein X942_5959 [Burkholderia pseudomallei MSHR5596]